MKVPNIAFFLETTMHYFLCDIPFMIVSLVLMLCFFFNLMKSKNSVWILKSNSKDLSHMLWMYEKTIVQGAKSLWFMCSLNFVKICVCMPQDHKPPFPLLALQKESSGSYCHLVHLCIMVCFHNHFPSLVFFPFNLKTFF